VPSDLDLFIRFGTALAIGFLMGLQREFAHGGEGRSIIAGERTFALVGLGGSLAAMLADELGSAWILVLVLGAFGRLSAMPETPGSMNGSGSPAKPP
jgi:uncharacterized membrane protein YhiD involved in acid resistance